MSSPTPGTTPRHALVTGGSSGIGLAVARRLLADGWHVSLVARDAGRLDDAGRSLAEAAPGAAPRIALETADVRDADAVEGAVRRCEARAGAVTWAVASAGAVEPGRFSELPAGSFRRMMDVNFFGALNLVHSVLPSMRAAGRGRLVLVSSGAALIGQYGYSAYGASKFALRGLAESLKAELDFEPIGISIVYPPDTDTPQLHEERRTRPAETGAIAAQAKVWSADDVARHIVDGAARGRFAITPGWEMSALGALHSVLAPVLRRHFHRIAARARRG